ncbi:MAG: AgmX/PglI C-terminal domain-containing protein [Archangium sp.]
MAELSEDDLTRLEKFEAGELPPVERAAFEAELAARPELREVLERARAVALALPAVGEPTLREDAAKKVVGKALGPDRSSRSKWWPLLVAAGLLAFGWWRFGFDEVETLRDVVTIDGRTVVAAESVTSADEVVTGESGAAIVRRRRSTFLIPASSLVRLRLNTVERGAVVVQGEARLFVNATAIEIDGEAIVAVEPIDGSFRETSHLEPGDVMDPKTLRVVGGGAALGAAAVTIYVLSGSAWITPADELAPVQVDAGAVWTSARPKKSKPIGQASDDELWPQDPSRARASAPSAVGFDASVPAVALAPPSVGSSANGKGDGNGMAAPATPPKRYAVDVEGIRSAIGSALPDIEECYEGWVQQQPQLGGRIVIGFQIGADDAGTGSVTDISIVDGGLGHALMEGCVMNAMQDLAFERPEETVTVKYPFMFSAGPDDGGTPPE